MTGVEWSVAACILQHCCSLHCAGVERRKLEGARESWVTRGRRLKELVGRLKAEGARGYKKGQFVLTLAETACGMWLEIPIFAKFINYNDIISIFFNFMDSSCYTISLLF